MRADNTGTFQKVNLSHAEMMQSHNMHRHKKCKSLLLQFYGVVFSHGLALRVKLLPGSLTSSKLPGFLAHCLKCNPVHHAMRHLHEGMVLRGKHHIDSLRRTA